MVLAVVVVVVVVVTTVVVEVVVAGRVVVEVVVVVVAVVTSVVVVVVVLAVVVVVVVVVTTVVVVVVVTTVVVVVVVVVAVDAGATPEKIGLGALVIYIFVIFFSSWFCIFKFSWVFLRHFQHCTRLKLLWQLPNQYWHHYSVIALGNARAGVRKK